MSNKNKSNTAAISNNVTKTAVKVITEKVISNPVIVDNKKAFLDVDALLSDSIVSLTKAVTICNDTANLIPLDRGSRFTLLLNKLSNSRRVNLEKYDLIVKRENKDKTKALRSVESLKRKEEKAAKAAKDLVKLKERIAKLQAKANKSE